MANGQTRPVKPVHSLLPNPPTKYAKTHRQPPNDGLLPTNGLHRCNGTDPALPAVLHLDGCCFGFRWLCSPANEQSQTPLYNPPLRGYTALLLARLGSMLHTHRLHSGGIRCAKHHDARQCFAVPDEAPFRPVDPHDAASEPGYSAQDWMAAVQ
ncbi:hypothetical protein D1872_156060 [compost metagenome]